MDPVQRAVDLALDRIGLDRSAPVVVACSGGPDSSALAHAVMALARLGRLGPVTLCHVDHRLREGSAAEAEIVKRLAGDHASFVALAVDVDLGRGSLEEAAREARYAALDRVAAELGAAAVLVGHTADDQAETVLMRILAGTGIGGLAGIPARRGLIARPLLEVERAAVVDYCRRHALETAVDPTNLDMRHLRNRVRHQILPLLRAENPQLDRALVGLARRAEEASELVDGAAAELAERADQGDGWDVKVLAAAPPLVAARALALAAARAGAGPLSARHHAALDSLLRRARGGSATLDLPGGRVIREYDRLRFAGAEPHPPDLQVCGPGSYEVRTARPGDRMQPVRLRGRSRKLSDLFIDARVPRRLRTAARVVVRVSDGRIEWAEHIGPAHGSDVDVTLTHSTPVATNKG